MFRIMAIPLADVNALSGIRYNTNNCWHAEKRPKPADYAAVQEKCNTEHWIYKFRSLVVTITLDAADLTWMKAAQRIGRMTRQFSRLHLDELQETVAKYQFPDNGQWFVRTEYVSLKNGQYGVGPYTSLDRVISSLVSSNPGHECFTEANDTLTLYLVPFLRLNGNQEFRVFVYKHNVTAISVQHLYEENAWIQGMTFNQLLQMLSSLLQFYKSSVLPKMADMESYTFDVVLLETTPTEWYFIEFNPFGADYSAGSSLFGWQQDHATLTSQGDVIEFRYPTI